MSATPSSSAAPGRLDKARTIAGDNVKSGKRNRQNTIMSDAVFVQRLGRNGPPRRNILGQEPESWTTSSSYAVRYALVGAEHCQSRSATRARDVQLVAIP